MKKYNDAINIGLQIIGEQTIEGQISIDGIYEAEQMSMLIDLTKAEVLAEGWVFNTDTNWTLVPDNEGYIVVPADVLKVDASGTTNIIRKDGKLYDRANQTYKFTNSVACDVTWDIEFDELPPIMQQYITLKASRLLYQRLVGDANMLNVLLKDEQEAFFRVKLHEDDIGDYNIFDDQSVSRVITRTANPTGLRG
jgi:hypothetical protein